MIATYFEDYVPVDARRFEQMLKCFRSCGSKDDLQSWVTLFTFDAKYARDDIIVALGQVEREKGWH